jgi:hypothetical protein
VHTLYAFALSLLSIKLIKVNAISVYIFGYISIVKVTYYYCLKVTLFTEANTYTPSSGKRPLNLTKQISLFMVERGLEVFDFTEMWWCQSNRKMFA